MKLLLIVLSLFFAVGIHSELYAQRKKTPEQEYTITPEDGRNKEAENKRKKQEEYALKKQQHELIQDKATRKRMKENYKKAKRNANPGKLPWYKRIF
jgi:uncharacterized protein HemX